jgi:hypothetical protein
VTPRKNTSFRSKVASFPRIPLNDISHVHEKLTTAPFGLGAFSFANDFSMSSVGHVLSWEDLTSILLVGVFCFSNSLSLKFLRKVS